jgi:hypothetical protein
MQSILGILWGSLSSHSTDKDKVGLRGCLFSVFIISFISFRNIQKLDGLKSKKLEAKMRSLPASCFFGHPAFGSPKS